MLTSYKEEGFWSKQPTQLADARRRGAVEADAHHAAFSDVDLQSIAFPGEQVRGELLQAGFVPDHDDVLFRVRVGP